jgi:hypothetical protein
MTSLSSETETGLVVSKNKKTAAMINLLGLMMDPRLGVAGPGSWSSGKAGLLQVTCTN